MGHKIAGPGSAEICLCEAPASGPILPDMKLTGISDEAGDALSAQIAAHKELGWDTIESRFLQIDDFDKGSIHEIPDEAFDLAATELENAGIKVCGVGSTIGNWAHSILDPFTVTEGEIERCIVRMQRLDCKIVRIMSYAILKGDDGSDLPDQHKEERFRRTRQINKRFADAGVTAVHENCMNYGGMSIEHALETLENVPGLKWVFDTGNPVFAEDRSNPGHRQDAWNFYQAVKEQIVHVHVKDGVWNTDKNDMTYTMPGDGDGDVERILRDLNTSGYDGYISIEPHVAAVFHASDDDGADPEEKQKEMFESYVAYGKRMQEVVDAL